MRGKCVRGRVLLYSAESKNSRIFLASHQTIFDMREFELHVLTKSGHHAASKRK